MPRGKQIKGTCEYCKAEFSKSGIPNHLPRCPSRQVAIENAERGNLKSETLFHLRVQDAWQKEFWFDLEMCGSSDLDSLDYYLRRIWLECCSHMSRFTMGSKRGEEVSKSTKANKVLHVGDKLTHIYDFGTSSETLIMVAGVRQGKPTTAHPLALMARNLMPESKCIVCDESATQLCMECLVENDVWGFLCEQHVRTHTHSNYGFIGLVNSPRLGMCGYTGPSDPPY